MFLQWKFRNFSENSSDKGSISTEQVATYTRSGVAAATKILFAADEAAVHAFLAYWHEKQVALHQDTRQWVMV